MAGSAAVEAGLEELVPLALAPVLAAAVVVVEARVVLVTGAAVVVVLPDPQPTTPRTSTMHSRTMPSKVAPTASRLVMKDLHPSRK
jgi:hypothetical protein